MVFLCLCYLPVEYFIPGKMDSILPDVSQNRALSQKWIIAANVYK